MGIKSFELEPTKENILATIQDDLLDRNKSVWQLARFCDAQEGRCSIALDARWGEGKTFFVKQTQLLFDSFNPLASSLNDEERELVQQAFSKYSGKGDAAVVLGQSLCVYYDAWSNDYDSDPILSLVYSITQSVAHAYGIKQPIDFGKTIAGIFDFFTGKNAKEMVELWKERDPLSDLKNQKETHELIAEFLDKLMEERGNRLIIFIDELDRCNPGYAVRLLERIKHYFINDRITFVFSINSEQLQHTIKCYYGGDFDACRYLDRFFDYRIPLPAGDTRKYYDKIGLENDSYVYEIVCRTIIKRFSFGLREAEKFYRTAKIAAYKPTHGNGDFTFSQSKGWQFTVCIIVPLLIGLQMKNTSQYSAFVEGRDSRPLQEIIMEEDTALLQSYGSLLLNEKESYSKGLPGGWTFVKLSDRLDQVYNALFLGKGKIDACGRVAIGQCSFSPAMKEKAINVASLMSEHAMI